jgi:type IV secretory pathway VirB6-like protein
MAKKEEGNGGGAGGESKENKKDDKSKEKKNKDKDDDEHSRKDSKKKEKFEKILDFVRESAAKLLGIINKLIIKIVLLHAIMLLLFVIVAFDFKDDIGTCYDANSFITKGGEIPAYHNKSGSYKHEDFTHFLEESDKKVGNTTYKLNGEPLMVKIKGSWSPLYGNISDVDQKNITINSDIKRMFLCAMEKQELKGSNQLYYHNEWKGGNIFYYVKNYYKSYSITKVEEKPQINAVEEPAERQEPCWITRGHGLYMGAVGTNGKIMPTEFHQILGNKMECAAANWFNGKKKEDDDEMINDYVGYTFKDFKFNYFSLEYYLKRDGKFSNDKDPESSGNIFSVGSSGKVTYNIELHEDLLYKNGIENVGLIIANSMSKFASACYTERIDRETNELKRTTDLHYFLFEPKNKPGDDTKKEELKRHRIVPGGNNYTEKYKYGEIVRFFILDKFYRDNIGSYSIEVLSGLELDEKGTLEGKIQDFEFLLLGSPKPGQEDDRGDGIMARIFHNILNNNFILIVRAALILFTAVYGIRILFGFGDKKMLSYNELIPHALKIAAIMALLTETGFQLLNKTLINFLVNGVVGLVDLVASIFYATMTDNVNMFGAPGGLAETSHSVISLARNFAAVDEILQLFSSEAILVKLFSFYFTGDFLITLFGLPLLLYTMYRYVKAIVLIMIPFLMVVIQWALTIPLAPIMLLFSFFKQTEGFFKNWIKFLLSKALELFAFFLAFYFWTGLINNSIKELLKFETCIGRLGSYVIGILFTDLSTVTPGAYVAIAAITATAVIAIVEAITTAASDGGIGNILYAAVLIVVIVAFIVAIVIFLCMLPYFKITVSSFKYYKDGVGYKFLELFADMGVLLLMIMLFEASVKDIMTIVSSLVEIDGAKGDTKGPMGDLSKFGVDEQFKEFNAATGFAEMQKNTDMLKWTRGLVDLEKGVGDNIKQAGELATYPLEAGMEAETEAFQAWTAGEKDENGKRKSLAELRREKWKKAKNKMGKKFFGENAPFSPIIQADDSGEVDSAFGGIIDIQPAYRGNEEEHGKPNSNVGFRQRFGKKANRRDIARKLYATAKNGDQYSLVTKETIDNLRKSGKEREAGAAEEMNRAFVRMGKNKATRITGNSDSIDRWDVNFFEKEMRRIGYKFNFGKKDRKDNFANFYNNINDAFQASADDETFARGGAIGDFNLNMAGSNGEPLLECGNNEFLEEQGIEAPSLENRREEEQLVNTGDLVNADSTTLAEGNVSDLNNEDTGTLSDGDSTTLLKQDKDDEEEQSKSKLEEMKEQNEEERDRRKKEEEKRKGEQNE